MNFFFGLNNSLLDSTLTIPRFQNSSRTKKQYKIYELQIINKKWTVNALQVSEHNKNFYEIDSGLIHNENIFFLATEDEILEIKNNNYSKLLNLNKFTHTSPAFRANLQVSNNSGGFSSYQSEYPFQMVKIKGSILSSLNSLCNRSADHNIIFLKNIYELPIQDEFGIYFINLKTKKVLKKMAGLTNYMNEFVVEKELIQPEIFLFTDKFIGIPIFCSIKDNHISLEHSNPPHEYIMSKDRYKTVNALKNEFHEIIS